LQDKGVETSYGRAAKLLAVYIKAMVIVAGAEQSPLALIAHPPIDRTLLKNLSFFYSRPKLRQNPWTQLNKNDYYRIVNELRSLSVDQPFWMLEEHWPITNNGIESSETDEIESEETATPPNGRVENSGEPIPIIDKSQILLCSADAGPNAQSKVACEAGYFYPGAKWVGAVRNSSTRLGCDFAILTTGHGMVNSWDTIAPYNMHINAFPKQVRENFERTIHRWFERKKYKLVIFYGGGVPRFIS
jgi:hypothetical protein